MRFCYERSLQSRPSLQGRVATRFVIGLDGRVSAASADGFDRAIDGCIAAAVARWQFVPRCAGLVSYPFTLVPADAVATRTAP